MNYSDSTKTNAHTPSLNRCNRNMYRSSKIHNLHYDMIQTRHMTTLLIFKDSIAALTLLTLASLTSSPAFSLFFLRTLIVKDMFSS